jgi:hypothetical protein
MTRQYFDQDQKFLAERCRFRIIRIRQARRQLPFHPLGDQNGYEPRWPKRTARAPAPPALSRPKAPKTKEEVCAGNNTRVSIAVVGMIRLPLNQDGESVLAFVRSFFSFSAT